MVPVTTLQGLEPDELVRRIGRRDVVVWGSGDIGLDVLTSLRGAGVSVRALLHTRAGGEVYGLPVLAAAEVLDCRSGSERPFVVIATAQYRLSAEAACLGSGMCKGSDFVDYLAIRRPVGVVELVGPDRAGSVPTMPFAVFREVFEKMRREQPQLCHVELAWLGDPLGHPELPEIVAYCERFVPCTVSTTLDTPADIAGVVAAAPSRFNVVVYGFGESFGRGRAKCSWKVFQDNLAALKSAIPAARGRTRFTLRYLRTRREPKENIEYWQKLLGDGGIALAVDTPYPFPYDHLLARCERHSVAWHAESLIADLPWNIGLALSLAYTDRDNACLSQRLFPVVGHDLSVGGCHLYEGATLAPNYLENSWEELLRLRRESVQCRRCQIHGLHRLDLPVLSRRFPGEKDKLFSVDEN